MTNFSKNLEGVGKLYLPGLNGLRALAASAVVLSHISLNLPKFGLPGRGGLDAANFGVTVFFSLSGFLITYLLLVERNATGTVDTPKFYVRRILRIWPLYFLYMVIVLLYCGLSAFNEKLLWYIFFVPNVAFVIQQSIPLMAHYWSLGVEEQFYLIWPLIAKRVASLAALLMLFVVSFFLLKVMMKFLQFNTAYAFLHYSRFSCMALGALAALAYHEGHSIVELMTRRYIQWIWWVLFALVAMNMFHLASIIDHEIIAVATVGIIFSQVKGVGLVSLENKWMNYLGQISYGMYVFNPLVISVLALAVQNLWPGSHWLKYVVIFVTVPSLVLFVSHLSYKYFESKFRMWKEKYVVVKT